MVLLKIIIIILFVLISVAYLTLLERKLMGSMQRRRGPNVIGYKGLLQPLADGLKLFTKETILPSTADGIFFLLAPIIVFLLSLIGWAAIPFSYGQNTANINLGILYLFAISALNIYGILLAGWTSNSKYAFLGATRSIAQMISYEISIGLIISNIALLSKSFNLYAVIMSQSSCWFIFILFPVFLMFFVSGLAETNRHPFDLPEAEAELVSGYNVEYSGMSFALFFLGEYANMILMSSFTVILFLGGWLPPISNLAFLPLFPNTAYWLLFFKDFEESINYIYIFCFSSKILFFIFLFCMIRAAVPRYRYDQLMYLGWKTFLPLAIIFLFLTASFLVNPIYII